MKKIYKILLGIVVVLVIIIGYVQYKFISTENAVVKYLTVNQRIPEESILINPFIANLKGDKNWMTSVKVEGDARTYYYFLNNEDKVVLESFVENGTENVLNQIMN